MQDAIEKLSPALIAAININCSDAEWPPAAAMPRLKLLQPIDFEKLDLHAYSVQGRKGGLVAGPILAASVRESRIAPDFSLCLAPIRPRLPSRPLSRVQCLRVTWLLRSMDLDCA